MTKKQWKLWHRALRVAKRESIKAQKDLIIYGVSFVSIGANGAKRIHPSKIVINNTPQLAKQ